MLSLQNTALIKKRPAAASEAHVTDMGRRAHRWPRSGPGVITARHVAAGAVTVLSAVILLCGHSGVGMLVVLIGMCVVGIAGHNG
jgi:hypothetical protein